MNNQLSDNILELHYYFIEDEKPHSMDAFVRNKCESELLQIVNTISKELNIHIKVETEVYVEGGLKEFYTFLGTAEGQIILSVGNFIIAALGVILSRVPLKKSKLDKEEQNLSIEEKKLNIEVQKLNIELLKKELEEKKLSNSKINIENLNYIVNNNIKIIKHKSNFYKTVNSYKKVNKISTSILNQNRAEIEPPQTVERKDFERFILESDNLEPFTDENATIEIISPVLKKGRFKWRGIYNQNPQSIEFSMTDKDFKKDVIDADITFKSGTFIDCILKVYRKIDDLGNVYNSNYSVITVLRQHEDGVITETNQGRKLRNKKEAEKSQPTLFDDLE